MKTVYVDLQDPQSLMSPAFQFFVQDVVLHAPFVLLVTAEWCGHCKEFHPVIKNSLENLKAVDLAELESAPKKKVVAKRNNKITKKRKVGGANEVYVAHLSDVTHAHLTSHDNVLGKLLQAKVRGFPTCIGVTAKHRNKMGIMVFDEARTEDNFIRFVTQIAKT